MEWSLTGSPLTIILRPLSLLADDELMALSRRDKPYRIEKSSDVTSLQRLQMGTWIANGAQLTWMLDPYAGTLTIYRPSSDPEVLSRPDVVEGEEPVASFRLTTSNLWAR